ncbi:beta-1,3-galactosyltransferase 9 [Microcaecilia unicolor]|uniref:Hexosyltransferase n=1 Tax=Microcaecilia unicolor TaxID=1415580 RepID=A0A6P7YID7_9AMPH|nr:putative UDP-GlcNAc:betaGal beta-1,3-N-acetylglucosaminyltransferase LOC100288842 [Microcaecilia unicolor]
MQVALCRLRTHQWCFILFNIMLFHALLFGADFVEEYLLQSLPVAYTDVKVLEIREQARKLDMESRKDNISKSYLISGVDACSGQDVFLLSVIFSNPANRMRRDLIRQTWANVTHVKEYTILTMFALGKPNSETTQLEILKESESHGDIIEGSFLESSQNQTLKTIMVIQWIVTFCPSARFVLKTNEDMFVNILSLVDYLLSLRIHPEDIYMGRVIHQALPIRDPQSYTFFIPKQYEEKFYPDYCSGTAYVISQDVARKVYVVSNQVPMSLPSDVFVGICAHHAGIAPIHSSRFSGHRHIIYNRCCYKFIFTSAGTQDEELIVEWREISDGKKCSVLQTYYGLVSCKVWTYLDKLKYLKNEALSFSD